MKIYRNKTIVVFGLILVLYFVFCWINYWIIEGNEENNLLLNNQYIQCEKYDNADEIEKKRIYEKYKNEFIVDDDTCSGLIVPGSKPNSAFSIFQGFLNSEKIFIPFFIPLIVIFPFMYFLSKEYYGQIVKPYCLRNKYKNYLKHIFKISYLNIFTMPLFIFISFLICLILANGNTNIAADLNLNISLPNVKYINNSINYLLYFLILFLNSGIYINVGLSLLNKNKKFIISIIECLLCLFLIWGLGEIIIGPMLGKIFNISSNNFNILNIYDWIGVTNKYVYLGYNLALFLITGGVCYLTCKNREKFIIMCEK